MRLFFGGYREYLHFDDREPNTLLVIFEGVYQTDEWSGVFLSNGDALLPDDFHDTARPRDPYRVETAWFFEVLPTGDPKEVVFGRDKRRFEQWEFEVRFYCHEDAMRPKKARLILEREPGSVTYTVWVVFAFGPKVRLTDTQVLRPRDRRSAWERISAESIE